MSLALTYIHTAVLLMAAVAFIAAAISDVRSYRIPNKLCLFLLFLFPVFVATSTPAVAWDKNLIVFAAVSLIGFAAFWKKVMGAGDVKLLSIASLWAGLEGIGVLLIVTAIAGGIQAVFIAARLKIKSIMQNKPVCLSKAKVPYGVAIATGGLAVLGRMIPPLLLPE